MPPDRGLANKLTSGVKGKRNRLTYLVVTNADGSKKLPPLIIGKAQKPRAFTNKTGAQLGFHYRSNAKAWMTSTIYQEWLLDWDRALRNEDRKILLLQDNFSGHVIPEQLTNIHVINFEPNLTAHVQPNDQGIIRCFKANYRAKYIQRAIDLYETNITPSQIYDINQLQAMRLAEDAWNEVDTMTIRNCWHKANILPDTDSSSPSSSICPSLPISSLIHTTETLNDPCSQAEKRITEALDELEATGALQRSNRMDLAELLNPAVEAHDLFEATDEDIFQAVMDAKMAREANRGGDSDEVADDSAYVPSRPRPTRNEALQATLLLRDYINELDDSFARKLEVMLGSFGRRT